MKDNHDVSVVIKNPFADRVRECGYSTPNGYYSPKDLEEMNCSVESVIPKDIRKRIRKAVTQDIANTRSGGVSIGALIRLVGLDGAESLYNSDPEGYIQDIERVEKLLEESNTQLETEETIKMLPSFDKRDYTSSGAVLPQANPDQPSAVSTAEHPFGQPTQIT